MNDSMRDGLIKRGSTWSYVVRETDPTTGKRRPRWIGGFPTRTAAKQARDAARHAVNRGTYVAPQDLTVAGWLERWIEAHEIELKPSTAASYRANIRTYLVPHLGHERLQALSPSRLSVVFRRLSESGGRGGRPLSPRTVEFARAVLRRALQDAVVDRVLEVNPVVGTKRPRQVKTKHTTWTGEQLLAFLGHVQEHRLAPLWTLAAATGMRRGELLALRWTEVDLDGAEVAVERSVTVIDGVRHVTDPKNHERRRVKVDPRTVAALRAWRVVQAQERLAWGEAYHDVEGLVFTWEDGAPLAPEYASKAFQRAQTGFDGSRLTLHEIRHSHATLLLRAGEGVHIVARRLGHKDPSVTLNVYADVIPDDDGRAVEVFSRVVWGA